MNKQYYDLLGITEDATDEEIAARYEELKKKYSEERFLEGEAGNEAAKLLSRVEVAYAEIMSERKEKRSAENADSSYAKVEQFIRDGKINEAQGALDEFNERPAEWHYLQSVVFYKKNWMNESKKQLELAVDLEPENEKYKRSLENMKKKIDGTNAFRQNSSGQNAQDGRNANAGGQQDYATQRTYQQDQTAAAADGCCTACQCAICADCCCECLGGDLIRCC